MSYLCLHTCAGLPGCSGRRWPWGSWTPSSWVSGTRRRWTWTGRSPPGGGSWCQRSHCRISWWNPRRESHVVIMLTWRITKMINDDVFEDNCLSIAGVCQKKQRKRRGWYDLRKNTKGRLHQYARISTRKWRRQKALPEDSLQVDPAPLHVDPHVEESVDPVWMNYSTKCIQTYTRYWF